jgi:hypothetical protein
MKASEVENWALKVLDSLRRGEPLEDSRVELKATFNEPPKIARRLAGHANAARGEDILWLFGVDEKSGVQGVKLQEFASWWSEVKSQFESLAPEVMEINVPYEGVTVVALLAHTDRAPFVVKNPFHGQSKGGPVEFEVPWREMTSIRTARRSDLLRLLVPLRKLPSVEVISATLIGRGAVSDRCGWDLFVDLYITPPDNESMVFPAHKLRVEVTEPCALGCVSFKNLAFKAIGSPGGSSLGTKRDLVISGPGRVEFTADYHQDLIERNPGPVVDVSLRLQPAHIDRAISLSCTLAAAENWSYNLKECKSSAL